MTLVCVSPLQLALSLGKITLKSTVWDSSSISYLSHFLTLCEISPPIIFLLCNNSFRGKKISSYRPGQDLTASKVEDPRTSRQLEHEGGKGC
jgi:hypothetical protein